MDRPTGEAPMSKANPHPFESWEYIAHIAKVNAALSDCLGVPLDPAGGAAKYEKAVIALATPAEWPGDAVPRAQKYDGDFAWMVRLFEARIPGSRCPAWEQLKGDLTQSESFRDGIAHRVRRNPVLRKQFDPETAYLEVVAEAQRIIIGKAAYLRDKAIERPDRNWLLEAFAYGRRAFFSFLWVVVNGKAKPPKRDATRGTVDRLPPPGTPARPHLDNLIDLHSGDDGSLAEELLGEGKEPPPEVGAIVAELKDDLTRLAGQEQQVIQLRYYEEKPWKETAAAMNCTVYEAQQRHESALEKLRRGRTHD